MTAYSKEKFKELWESNDDGGGITYDDIADCAIAWNITSKPRTNPIMQIQYLVLKAADVKDYEEYKTCDKCHYLKMNCQC